MLLQEVLINKQFPWFTADKPWGGGDGGSFRKTEKDKSTTLVFILNDSHQPFHLISSSAALSIYFCRRMKWLLTCPRVQRFLWHLSKSVRLPLNNAVNEMDHFLIWSAHRRRDVCLDADGDWLPINQSSCGGLINPISHQRKNVEFPNYVIHIVNQRGWVSQSGNSCSILWSAGAPLNCRCIPTNMSIMTNNNCNIMVNQLSWLIAVQIESRVTLGRFLQWEHPPTHCNHPPRTSSIISTKSHWNRIRSAARGVFSVLHFCSPTRRAPFLSTDPPL